MQEKVSYNGKSVMTKHHKIISDELQRSLKEQYYKLPPIEEVNKQFECIKKRNGVKNDKITNYYFKKLMSKVQVTGAKWSLEEVFNSKELLGLFISKVEKSPKIFPEEKGLLNNIERAIALGGKGYARKPTQFPLKVVNEVLKKYNINNNFYDFSCGWGMRLLGAMKNEINYYGTDPNYLLVNQLEKLKEDYCKKYPIKSSVNILPQGSEIYVPEWENIMGLAFSSPPYFNMEDYKIGKQSYSSQISYEEWKQNFLFPTYINIYKYLIEQGVLVLNIKDVNVDINLNI